MKKPIITSIIVLAIGVLAPQIASAQGNVTYLSNLGQPSTGNLAVGSNSWLATEIYSGNNAGGYVINSVQLAMTDASGNPSGFTAMLYGMSSFLGAGLPGISLGTLNGSTDPVTAGVYTYTAPLGLTLSPSSYYFIVLTSGTAVANGAYEWSLAGTYSYNPAGGWAVGNNEDQVAVYLQSSQGSSWSFNEGNIQFALDATPAPEPSSEILLGLGGLAFLWRRWRAKCL